MRAFIKWSLFIALVAASVLVVIHLPKYITLQKDREYVNQYTLYEQNTSDESYMDMELSEKIEILLLVENSICITETTKADEVLKSNASLFDELKKQMQRLQDLKLIPAISSENTLAKDMAGAELYALTSDQHPGKILYVWELSFINEDMVCSVTMDADTYKIYNFYADGSVVTSYVMDAYEGRMEAVGGEFDSLYKNWFDDYLCYLYDCDVSVENAKHSAVVEELKWDNVEAVGWVNTDSVKWNLHLCLGASDPVFYFRMASVYEYDAMTQSDSYIK